MLSLSNNIYVRNVSYHLFKGFIDRVDLIPGTENEVEVIDYKTGDEPGPGERSRQLLLYAHGFSHRHPEYTVRRLSLELLSKPKPRVYELGGAGYVSPEVVALGAGVLEEMVDVAESILQDYRHGFVRVDDGGGARGAGIGCIVGESGWGLLFGSQVCHLWLEYPEKSELWYNAVSS